VSGVDSGLDGDELTINIQLLTDSESLQGNSDVVRGVDFDIFVHRGCLYD
jgi:hypothetical protein